MAEKIVELLIPQSHEDIELLPLSVRIQRRPSVWQALEVVALDIFANNEWRNNNKVCF